MVADCSVLSPEPPVPDSPHTSLVLSGLPLLEPRVSGCKRNFVQWPLKRLSASPVISLWWTEILLLLTVIMLFGFLSWFWCCRLESPAWGLDPTLLMGTPKLLKYPSGTSAATCGCPARTLVPPPYSLPFSLWWSEFFCLCLVVRLLSSCVQLTIHDDFSKI